MKFSHGSKQRGRPFALLATPFLLLAVVVSSRADENLFGYVRSTETVPRGHADLYHTLTLRSGKDTGTYRGWDSEAEVEYGVTDRLQSSFSLINHAFTVRNNSELDDQSRYRFGGVELAAKYRFKSPFKDGYGLAFRPVLGFLRYDDVAGIIQGELIVGNDVIVQRNFLEDTVILSGSAGFQFAWGKRPAEQYDHELALEQAGGVSYRVAPKWFVGAEEHFRSEYPNFKIEQLEHAVLFVGPSLHYGARRWWVTATWVYQVWGHEVEAVVHRKAYAEEARNEYRIKIGLDF